MKHPMTVTPLPVLGLLLSPYATAEQAKASSTGVKTEERAGVSAEGTTVARVKVETMTATVEEIDLATRMVTLRGPDGSYTLHVSEQARNLDEVKVGDKVTVEYYEGLIAEMLPPGSAATDMKVTEGIAKAPLGARPAGAAGKAVTATVVIEHVDTLRNTIFFKGPLGKTRVVKAMKPEFQAMLRKLKPGDRVNLTYFEAMAVSVKPASK